VCESDKVAAKFLCPGEEHAKIALTAIAARYQGVLVMDADPAEEGGFAVEQDILSFDGDGAESDVIGDRVRGGMEVDGV
jgi:hypothetical protein